MSAVLLWNKVSSLIERRPMVMAQIGESSIPMLYDTGACATVLREDQFKKISKNGNFKKIKTETPHLYSASGNKLPLAGTYQIDVTIQGVTKPLEIFVVKELQEKAIMGMNGIKMFGLHYDSIEGKCFIGERLVTRSKLVTRKQTVIEPLSEKWIRVMPEQRLKRTEEFVMATVSGRHLEDENLHGLVGATQMVPLDEEQHCNVLVRNTFPYKIYLPRKSVIGVVESLEGCNIETIAPEKIQEENARREKMQGLPPTKEDKEFVRKYAKLNVPEEEKERYLRLLECYHDVFSRDKTDLGRTDSLEHQISLTKKDPVYIKQFRLPENHRRELEKHVADWLKLGIVQPGRSRFNSPMFMVTKKDGSLRPVQDFRALNAQSYDDKYSMRDITECIDEIGYNGSTIFSTLDLTSGFWQMLLEKESRPFTAFTVPGMGQFQWVTSPMGLLGCPASFQRLMELVTMGLVGVIVYIDDLLIHSKSHEEHRQRLERVFARLRGHNLKINLAKCEFGAKEVNYLGFRLTPEGIFPGLDKTEVIRNAQPPTNAQEVRQFLGLCNFFRNHIPNFARKTAELCKLTKKGVRWNGECPPEALREFENLKEALCTKPMLKYPQAGWKYHLFTDASTGTDAAPGGLGAMLCQLEPQNKDFHVIGYASRRLQDHEKNYSPFLLEQAAAVWGMEHFQVYLKGNPFILTTDHKPLESLSKIHTKTLRRLQEAMNEFNFEVKYLKGEKMPADFLSRCQKIASITITSEKQEKEADFNKLELEFNHGFWRHRESGGIFVPQGQRKEVLELTHSHHLIGHKGINQTMERLKTQYWWPGWRKSVMDFVQQCSQCVQKEMNNPEKEVPLQPNSLCSEPNQRIHVDLFGPVHTSEKGNKYILVITDAFTKYLETVPIPDKEAKTVASAIYNRWICRFGIPESVLSDGGKEFVNDMSSRLYQLLNIVKLTTSAYHPQCNAQAEVINKSIAKYMRTMLEDEQLDWEFYLPSMTFSYNTSYHRSIKTTPYEMTFGHQAKGPDNINAKKYFEGDTVEEWAAKFQRIHTNARSCLQEAQDNARKKHDDKSLTKPLQIQQKVWLDHHLFVGKTRKFAHHWKGPYEITRVLSNQCVEIKNEHGRKWMVHPNRLRTSHLGLEPEESSEEMKLDDQTNKQKSEEDRTVKENKESRHKMITRSRIKKNVLMMCPIFPDNSKERNLWKQSTPQESTRPKQIKKLNESQSRLISFRKTNQLERDFLETRIIHREEEEEEEESDSESNTSACSINPRRPYQKLAHQTFQEHQKLSKETRQPARTEEFLRKAFIFGELYQVTMNGMFLSKTQEKELRKMVLEATKAQPGLRPEEYFNIIASVYVPGYRIHHVSYEGDARIMLTQFNEPIPDWSVRKTVSSSQHSSPQPIKPFDLSPIFTRPLEMEDNDDDCFSTPKTDQNMAWRNPQPDMASAPPAYEFITKMDQLCNSTNASTTNSEVNAQVQSLEAGIDRCNLNDKNVSPPSAKQEKSASLLRNSGQYGPEKALTGENIRLLAEYLLSEGQLSSLSDDDLQKEAYKGLKKLNTSISSPTPLSQSTLRTLKGYLTQNRTRSAGSVLNFSLPSRPL